MTRLHVITILRYQTEFGFTMPGRKVFVDDVRVRGVGRTAVTEERSLPTASGPPVPEKVRRSSDVRLSTLIII